MANEVEIIDNSEEVLEAIENAKKAALEAIGATAEGYAKGGCPVDTGRLRASITFATPFFHSTGEQEAKPEDYEVRGTPEEDTVYIGTNVEYAEAVETDDSKRHRVGGAHYLRNAATGHTSEYEKLVTDIMERA